MDEVVVGTFLDYVAWLRGVNVEYQVADDASRIGHLDMDYSNLHVVAALLTQCELNRAEQTPFIQVVE